MAEKAHRGRKLKISNTSREVVGASSNEGFLVQTSSTSTHKNELYKSVKKAILST